MSAVRDGSVAGYLIGTLVPQFKGKLGIFVPEWANAAEPEGSDEICGELYSALSGRWIDNGCVFHAVSVLVSEDTVVTGLSLMGFGHLVIDAVRDLTEPPETRQVPGRRFRLSHFAPVCRSLCRTVDERILWARGTRERDSMW